MVNDFKNPKKLEFEPLRQTPADSYPNLAEESKITPADSEVVTNRAKHLIDEYSRTEEFMKFVEELLREQGQFTVTIDWEDEPEVAVAMTRIFSNPNPTINQDTYYDIVDMLDQIYDMETKLYDATFDPTDIPDISDLINGEVSDPLINEDLLALEEAVAEDPGTEFESDEENKVKSGIVNRVKRIREIQGGFRPEYDIIDKGWRKL